jgi:hypothetical protein
VSAAKDIEEVGSEAAIFQGKRNSSLDEVAGPENGRGSSQLPIPRRTPSGVTGRGAYCLGGSWAVRSSGPNSTADPGGSNSKARWESWSPKGQGFLGNASSAESQPILRSSLTRTDRKGNRFLLLCHGDTCGNASPYTNGSGKVV